MEIKRVNSSEYSETLCGLGASAEYPDRGEHFLVDGTQN